MKKLLLLFLAGIFGISASAQWLNNDECGTAFPLTVGAGCTTGDNTLATLNNDFTLSCGFAGDNTDAAVWFSFVAPASGTVTVSTDHPGTNFDTQINLLGAAAGDMTMCPATMFEYGCDEDGGAAAGGLSSTMTVGGLVPGQTYWIQLDGYAGDIGTYCIDVVEVPCSADVGTFTINATGGSSQVVGNTIYVCEDGLSCFEVLSNNDYSLPMGFASTNPAPCTTAPELMYAIYINNPPTTGNPDTDPNWAASGSLFWTGQDFSDCNPSAFPPTIVPGDDIWLVPVTVDDGDDDGTCGGLQIDGNADGCFDVGAPIEVHYLNDVTFSEVQTLCDGDVDITVSGGSPEVTGNNYTITNTGAGTLSGTPISHGGTINISGLVDGDSYSIQVVDPFGCTHTYNGTFSGDVTSPTITCPGTQNVSFDANCEFVLPDYTGLASTSDNCPSAVTVTQSPAIGATITTTTTVTLTATDAGNNSNSCTFSVVPSDNTAPTPVCQNITVDLDATGNVSITGADVDNGSTDNCGPLSFSVSPNSFTCADIGANTVTLTVSDGAGNSNTCSATVTVNDPNVPTASAGNDATICSVDTYTLSGSSGGSASSGTWSTSGDGSFSSATDPNAVYTPGTNDISSGSVILTWTTDPSPCATDADDMTLTINPTPAPVAAVQQDPTGCGVCDGEILVSGLTPGTTYDFSYVDASGTVNLPGEVANGSGEILLTGLCAGGFSSFSATLNGCTGTDAGPVVLSDPGSPVFTASFVSDPTSCGGADGEIEICGLTASTSYDNLTYNDGAGTVTVGGFTTDGSGCYLISGLSAGSYSSFVVTLSGCSGNDGGPVVLSDPATPAPSASLLADPTSCGAADGEIIICGLNASATYDSLVYNDGSGPINIGSFTTDGSGCYQITGLTAGSYSDFNVWSSGCNGVDAGPVVLTDPNSPTFTASIVSDPTSCGAADGIIEICGLVASTAYDSLVYDDGSGPINVGSFTTDGAGCHQISGLLAGTYTNFEVYLTGCGGLDAGPLVLTDPSAPSAPSAGVDTTYCEGDAIVALTATASAGGTMTWYDDAGLTNVVGSGATFTPSVSATGIYTFYVTETVGGCESPSSTVTIQIENCIVLELIIPTGFTPDGDGDNDVWEIQNLNVLYPDNVVRVYNRWGNLLFESQGYVDPWDGTYKGEDLPIGSYFFVIEFGDDSREPEKGSITIIR